MSKALFRAALVLALPAAADAGECGGTRICRCGDRVVEDYRLSSDLGPCPKNGLLVREGVTLDGGGHAVRGSRTQKTWGLMLDERSHGSRIVHIEVTGFERGVRVAGAQGVRLERVESHHNGDTKAHKGYGIDVARGASDVVIEGSIAHDNADEGVHVGTGAHRVRIVASTFANNYREDVYFLANEGNSLEGSTLRGSTDSSSASVYVKHAKGARIEGNRIEGRPIMVRGRSNGTKIAGNTLTQAGIVLEPYAKDNPPTVPSNTMIEGGSITFDKDCIRVLEANVTTIESVRLDCPRSLAVDGGSDIVAIDTGLKRIDCKGDGEVRIEKRVKVRFVDAEKRPLADVEVLGAGKKPLGRSGADGRFQGTVLIETRRCDEDVAPAATSVVVSKGDLEQSVPISKLDGDVVLAGASAAR